MLHQVTVEEQLILTKIILDNGIGTGIKDWKNKSNINDS